MKIEVIKGTGIAVISGGEVLVKDAQSALEMAITVKYKTGATKIVLAKETVSEHFFILSTGLAGEILQKFTNYQIKAAVYGDYSRYTSKLNCTPFVRQYDILSNRWGDLLCQEENQTNDTHRNSRSWS